MKQKILASLEASNGQFNLPKEVLEKLAAQAPADLSEEGLSAWVESVKPQMALLQSYADSRVSTALKDKQPKQDPPKTPELDLEKLLGSKLDEIISKTVEQKLSGLSGLEEKYKALEQKQTEIDNREKAAAFQELTKRVAKEVGLSDWQLDMVSSKVTPDMDETKVNEVFSACRKTFIEQGFPDVNGKVVTDDEAIAARADDFVKQFEAQK